MQREFNIEGLCNPAMHYMVDISGKINGIMQLIEKGKYFTINKPRQYGKTTTLFNIEKALSNDPEYLYSSISFEGMGDSIFNDEITFSPFVLQKIAECFDNEEIQNYLCQASKGVNNLDTLSKEITLLVKKYNKNIVLMIDEVDKSCNNQLFLSFLGMLRNKYLMRNKGKDHTFHSVILAGVHDVKTLKLKIRPASAPISVGTTAGDALTEQKFNSPWNIAANFKVDMSFNPKEISTMLMDYTIDTKTEMNIMEISKRIYHYTGGYPFLVSRVCKEIDEEIIPQKNGKRWTENDVDDAVRVISNEKNTNFESIIKNLENNEELYKMTEDITAGNLIYNYNALNPLTEQGEMYGIFAKKENKVVFHNKIYEEIITNYIASKLEFKKSRDMAQEAARSQFIKPDGRLDIEKVLLKFQEVIKEKYSQSEALKSEEFLEKDLRLLFLVFLKPIINGIGFSFKEVETSEEKRMDIVVIFRNEKFIVELKLWYSEVHHKEGITRLKDYMRREGAQKGYMLIMDKTRNKEFVTYSEEEIMMVWI